MTDPTRLTLVRALHTVIYVVMASASLVVLYAGITGATGPWLWVAAGLVAVENVVFAASGLKWHLTAIHSKIEQPSVAKLQRLRANVCLLLDVGDENSFSRLLPTIGR